MPKRFRNFILLILIGVASLAFGDAIDPVSVYLTLEGNPSTSITIRWVTDKNQESDKVEFRQGGYPHWQSVEGSHIPMPDGHPYNIHHTQLNGLKPNTDYLFRLDAEGPVYKFRTLPNKLHEPIRFVVGGDMLHDETKYFAEMNVTAAATDPMFAVLGGDIAYSAPKLNLFKEDVSRWINWLQIWFKTMVTKDGRLIPIVITIGNHEVIGRYDQPPERAKFFYSLFKWPTQGGYQVIDFDHYMSIWVLDSGHTHPIDGKQKEWLETTLNQRNELPHKFAVYHVPAYPSVRKVKGSISKQIRELWIPIFEDHGINTAFEHHDHAYKRTHPIYKGQIDSNKGVLYLGDGAWGVKKPRTPKSPNDRWYLAKTKSTRHFILVTLYGLKRHYKAID
ncbi:MAG: metallophosphoesterase family protein, partial [Chlamydiota bacterium]